MATGRKLAKPRTRASSGKAAAKAAQPLPVAVRIVPVPPAALVGEIASASPDPAPDAIIRLGAQLTIREAVPLRAELLERVDAVDLVALDASGVQKVDTAGLQVLLAFTRQRRAAATETLWTGCSEVLRKAAAALDLAQALGLPAGAAP